MMFRNFKHLRHENVTVESDFTTNGSGVPGPGAAAAASFPHSQSDSNFSKWDLIDRIDRISEIRMGLKADILVRPVPHDYWPYDLA